MSPLVSIDNIGLRDGVDAQSGTPVFDKLKQIVAVLNGGIDAANISPTAGIPGSRLSNVTGSQIPTDRLADKCVDSRVLKSDPSPTAPGAAIRDETYIKDGAITGKKLAAATVGGNQLKIASVSIVGANYGAVGATALSTGISSATAIPLSVVVSRSGVAAIGYITNTMLDTATGNYYVSIAQWWQSGATPTLNLTGYTIVLYYLTLASS